MTWPISDYLGVRPCPIDHDHADAWYCDDGGSGTLHLDVIQRDIRSLTEAVRRLK